MSRCIGDRHLKLNPQNISENQCEIFIATPEIKKLKRRIGDYILIASDGFWDMFSNEQAKELLLENQDMPPKKLARMLCQQAKKKWPLRYERQDDISAIVIQICPKKHKKPTPLLNIEEQPIQPQQPDEMQSLLTISQQPSIQHVPYTTYQTPLAHKLNALYNSSDDNNYYNPIDDFIDDLVKMLKCCCI